MSAEITCAAGQDFLVDCQRATWRAQQKGGKGFLHRKSRRNACMAGVSACAHPFRLRKSKMSLGLVSSNRKSCRIPTIVERRQKKEKKPSRALSIRPGRRQCVLIRRILTIVEGRQKKASKGVINACWKPSMLAACRIFAIVETAEHRPSRALSVHGRSRPCKLHTARKVDDQKLKSGILANCAHSLALVDVHGVAELASGGGVSPAFR